MYHMQHSWELFFQDGVVVDKLEGANPADLAQKIAKFVGSPLPKKVLEIEEVLEEAPADKARGYCGIKACYAVYEGIS